MRKILLVLVAIAACGDDQAEAPQLSRCEQFREHVIDLRLATATNVDADAHREVMRNALGPSFLDECARMPEDELECALAAGDAATAVACASNTSK